VALFRSSTHDVVFKRCKSPRRLGVDECLFRSEGANERGGFCDTGVFGVAARRCPGAAMLAVQVAQFVAFSVLAGVGLPSLLSVERTLGSIRQSLIKIDARLNPFDARLGALEAKRNGGDPHAHIVTGGLSPDRGRGQARTLEN
jgi:hypothetical protein